MLIAASSQVLPNERGFGTVTMSSPRSASHQEAGLPYARWWSHSRQIAVQATSRRRLRSLPSQAVGLTAAEVWSPLLRRSRYLLKSSTNPFGDLDPFGAILLQRDP